MLELLLYILVASYFTFAGYLAVRTQINVRNTVQVKIARLDKGNISVESSLMFIFVLDLFITPLILLIDLIVLRSRK